MIPYQEYSDAELVALLRRGDKRSFEAIYRRFVGDLYRYARKNIPVHEDCEEMVQEVFKSLWIRHETLRIESLRQYLLKSIRYMIIRYIRDKGVHRRYMEHYLIFATLYDKGEPGDADGETLRAMLIRGLDGLPERCKTAIKLRITENLSNQEVARRMNITKRTAELYMSKALCHLRTSFPEVSKADQ